VADVNARRCLSGGIKYNVPPCIGVSDYNSRGGHYTTFANGTDTSRYFKENPSASARYLAMSASASVSYALDKAYREEDQFAFYSFSADTYLASLKNYAGMLNTAALKTRLGAIPKPFNGLNEHHVVEWKEFFASFGSHVIVNTR